MSNYIEHRLRWLTEKTIVCGKRGQYTFEFVIGTENFPNQGEIQIYTSVV